MGYLSLQDYGVIGNQTSAALVSRLGSVDWCCFPYLDSPSHFGGILDDHQGGHFQIMPAGEYRSEQRYHQRTHVLETLFETPEGRAILTDWMPVGNGHSEDPSLCRQVEVIDGRVNWMLNCAPRFNYGLETARAEHFRGGMLFRGRQAGEIAQLRAEAPLELGSDGSAAVARFALEAPNRARFRWAWGRRAEVPLFADPFDSIEWWRNWSHRCNDSCAFAGPWHDLVARAGLMVKLLLAPYSGAIAEAITTSIPGTPGASRTGDFRYAWIRGSGMTIQALSALGYAREAEAYFSWICDLVARDGAENLQAVYTLDGGKELPEQELKHLAGYHGSKPVRIGNQAASEFQLDSYGHVMLAASEYLENTGDLPARVLPGLFAIADYLCQAWRRPDHGPWDTRLKPEHYVSSKVMAWVGLDRAIAIARAKSRDIPPRWTQERDILHRTILTNGFDSHRNTFVRSFSDNELDASVLMIPLVGFLPPDDPRVLGTLAAVQSRLGEGALLHRYSSGDGLPGAEGAHLQTSFLCVSCMALCGQVDEAADRLADLCTFATPLGFFGDQIASNKETSGNFPSASAQISLINAALYVGRARGLLSPPAHLIGAAPEPDPTSRQGRAGRRRLGFRPLRRAG